MASPVHDDDFDGQRIQTLDSSASSFPTFQQRFENSRLGKSILSVLIAAVLLLGITWNLPISPISRSLQKVMTPFVVPVGLDQRWGMFAVPETRVVSLDVDVTMANGDIRTWHMQPGAIGVGWWDRWTAFKYEVAGNPDSILRPQLAHWVVGQVTKPNERAVVVAVILRTENLSKPGGEAAGKSPASKILYRESLAPQ